MPAQSCSRAPRVGALELKCRRSVLLPGPRWPPFFPVWQQIRERTRRLRQFTPPGLAPRIRVFGRRRAGAAAACCAPSASTRKANPLMQDLCEKARLGAPQPAGAAHGRVLARRHRRRAARLSTTGDQRYRRGGYAVDGRRRQPRRLPPSEPLSRAHDRRRRPW